MKFLKVISICAFVSILAIGCGSGGGGGGSESEGNNAPSATTGNSEVKNITLYDNPSDSRIVSFQKDGKQLLFSGVKDSGGIAERIDSLYLVDGDKEYTIYYNEFGLPSKSVDHADGSMAIFEYSSDPLSSPKTVGAFERVLNRISAEITKITGTGTATSRRTESMPSVEVSTIGPSTETVEGNVEIDVDYCGEPAFHGTNVRVNYFGGSVNLWTEAKSQPTKPGHFVATIPEYYDPNLPDAPEQPTFTEVCKNIDKAMSLFCPATGTGASAATLCIYSGAAAPYCVTALTAFEVYCMNTAPGTDPGSILVPEICEATGKIWDAIPDASTMSVQAYVCPKGARSCKTDYLAKSAPKTINFYGKQNVSLWVDVTEPTFEGFTLDPLFPKMDTGYKVTANYNCIKGRNLSLEIGPLLVSSKNNAKMNDNISYDLPGREFDDGPTYFSDVGQKYSSDVINAKAQSSESPFPYELSNTLTMDWHHTETPEPTVPDDSFNIPTEAICPSSKERITSWPSDEVTVTKTAEYTHFGITEYMYHATCFYSVPDSELDGSELVTHDVFGLDYGIKEWDNNDLGCGKSSNYSTKYRTYSWKRKLSVGGTDPDDIAFLNLAVSTGAGAACP